MDLHAKAAQIKLLLMDVDGVLTNGRLYHVPGPDGKIVEWRHNEDFFGLLTQIGVVEPAQLFGGQFASGGQPRPNEARAQRR